ncbi:hypothetical protein OEB99_01495 [Actinotalea sp. M2MS4P-6]|uniref:hypothetical protein n=1 Tax=Actinotalea sp. M2MS4P-6 TaxID=2983762 RepID=UPI0021E48451|nr:hypothetical protein [Actinotalea sp. M2MS4P-6]MCV2392971.1 hypothetical protein [Actinotalea sp. M2MS4P-6]
MVARPPAHRGPITKRRVPHTAIGLVSARSLAVQAEFHAILDATTGRPESNILVALHQSFGADGGVDLDLPERTDASHEVDLV